LINLIKTVWALLTLKCEDPPLSTPPGAGRWESVKDGDPVRVERNIDGSYSAAIRDLGRLCVAEGATYGESVSACYALRKSRQRAAAMRG
jgi:hypothetical protein